MSDDASFSIDTSGVVSAVSAAEKAMDRMLRVLRSLDDTTNKIADNSQSALAQVSSTLKAMNRESYTAFIDAQKNGIHSLKTGQTQAMTLVRDQNQALQGLYEARLATAGRLSNQELQVWKQYGVNLGKIQQAQLKGWDLQALEANLTGAQKLIETKILSKLGQMTADNSPLASIRKSIDADSVTISAAMQKFYADQERILGRLGLLAQDNSPLRSIRQTLPGDSAAVLSAMQKFYADQERILSKLGVLALDNSPLRSIRVATPQDSAAILAAMNKFYADQERILNKLGTLAKDNSPLRSIRVATAEDSRLILSEMQQFYAKAEALAKTKSTILARRSAGEMVGRVGGATLDSSTTLSAMREYYIGLGATAQTPARGLDEVTEASKRAAKGATELAGGFKRLASDGNDVHSMARGLASGFNMLWLTWGNLAPLFIGAAISNAFVQTAKTGMDVAHTLGIIEHVGGNTKESMVALRDELDRLASSGPRGPKEVAEAMRVLSLAGLNANEILSVTKDVMNFSVAGTTSLETAAETLVAVTTAFGTGPQGFGKASDVISKAAAESMSSVESFANAMKTASVISAQYGVSLEDTATGIATLANLGIQGTAAGTALRNMYADLSGRSMQVAKILKQQNIELRDSVTGGFRPMVEVVAELNKKFLTLDAISQKNLMQALLSERGAKGLVEALRLIRTEAKDMGAGLSNALEEVRKNIADSEGFAAITAARMAQTTQNQFKQVGAVLQTTMVQAFREMEPALYMIANQMQEVFASDSFKTSLVTLVRLVADLGLVLAENAKLIGVVALGYGALKVAQMATVSTLTALTALQAMQTRLTAADSVALATNTAAQTANAAAKSRSLALAGGLARFVPVVGTALTVATGAWLLYEYFVKKSNDTSEDFHELYDNKIIKDLDSQADRLQRVNELRMKGLSLQEAEARMAGEAPELIDSISKAQSELDEVRRKLNSADYNENLFGGNEALIRQEEGALARLDAAKKRKAAVEAAAERMRGERMRENNLNDAEMRARLEELAKLNGALQFTLDDATGSNGNRRAASALEAIIEREREREAALKNTFAAENELSKIEIDKIKKLVELETRYRAQLDETKGLDEAGKAKLATDRATAEALIRANAELATSTALKKMEMEATNKLNTELEKLQETRDDAERSFQLERRASQLNNQDVLKRIELENGLAMASGTRRQATLAAYDVDVRYAKLQRDLATRYGKDVQAATESGQFAEADRITSVFNSNKEALDLERMRERGTAQAQVYKQAWDQVTTDISKNFVDQMMAGTFELEDFLFDTFANMVLRPTLEVGMKQGLDFLLGGAGGWFSKILSFDGGGYTGSGARAGGLDGKGGYLAMVHPDETVVDHTKGGGTGSVSVVIYNTVGDVATKSMLDKAMQAQARQVQGTLARSTRYNGPLS